MCKHTIFSVPEDFTGQCLQLSPSNRPSAPDLLLHPWLLQAQEEEGAATGEEGIVTFRPFGMPLVVTSCLWGSVGRALG